MSQKICPIKLMRNSDMIENLVCVREDCMWWITHLTADSVVDKSDCAIVKLAMKEEER